MDDFVGLMVPRPALAADLSREEKALAWNLTTATVRFFFEKKVG